MSKSRHKDCLSNTWHYQAMKDKYGDVTMREFYHEVEEGLDLWTGPIAPSGNDLEEMKYALTTMLKDLKKYGIIDEPPAKGGGKDEA